MITRLSRHTRVWLRIETACVLAAVTRGLFRVTGRINGLARNIQARAERLRRGCL